MSKRMSVEEFGGPLVQAEADLHGRFEKAFIGRLKQRYMTADAAIWKRTCELVGLLPKQARYVVARDFADQYLKAMNEAEDRRKREDRRKDRERAGEPLSVRRMLELELKHGPWAVKQSAKKRLKELDDREEKRREQEKSGS